MLYHYSLRSCRSLLWAVLLPGTCSRAMAQTTPDSTHLSYGEEVTTLPTVPLRVQAEDRGLWKLGLNNFLPGTHWLGADKYYTRYGVHIAYERRLDSPAWSVLGEVSPALVRYRAEPGASLQRSLSVRTQVAGRYYYNQERRLRLGRNTTHFSANYVSVALGAGLGKQSRETPLHSYDSHGRWLGVDAAVLYGLQRRWGRYGFVDANIGVSSLLAPARPSVVLNGSLRVGLTLGSLPALTYSPRPIALDTDVSLKPKAYAGVNLGGYLYQVHYSARNPYRGLITLRTQGYGTYEQPLLTPYVYAGYYLRPRLALQLGLQRQRANRHSSTTDFQGYLYASQTQEHDLAVPVLLRYGLTRSFLQHVQFDAVGGLVPEWSSVRYQEQTRVSGQPTDMYSFHRSTFGMHASLGLNLGYGFGRRRRIQATAEWVAIKDLRQDLQNFQFLQWGTSFGLRYRFGYQ
ncbi:hypothetical protein [Hymenobacter sp. GOD-10R]|uniref:hypothetical protein n=1 Tax=Hymenobacter sp. GOD-10R TaxID=3093922 RepID=UPI002D794087|nr:hypothetical protein [Hymenobacter sp. GOD-10R]WRQ26583.1 hypothetical protein SD425_16040 [Hymenobacter sp. GOD-10R]